ncbi:MAG TPA: helix-turn-helix transcriptional regulator [Bacteroidales bacterium]|nr:helix-turn-helix transcriptional regulator [Bacteroidales bacterium]
MKKETAVSCKTAIDNSYAKFIIPQYEWVVSGFEARKGTEEGQKRAPGTKHHSVLLTAINTNEFLRNFSTDYKSALNEAIRVFSTKWVERSAPQHKTPPKGCPEKRCMKMRSVPLFCRRTRKTLLASNYLLMKVTESILGTSGQVKNSNQRGDVLFSDDRVVIWFSDNGSTFSSPSRKRLQEWGEEKKGWMVAIHLLWCAYAAVSSNPGRSFVVRLSEISGLCGLKSIKSPKERLKKILYGVRLISSLSYTLDWPVKGKVAGFNIQPDLLWRTEIEEVVKDGRIVDYEIEVIPGFWASKFLSNGEGYLQYTTIAEESFNVITEFWQKRPDIVRLMCSVLYLKRINENKNNSTLTIRGERLLRIMCEPGQVEKILSGDSRQRRRFITNLHSALETLSEILDWRWTITNDFYDTEDKVPEEYNVADESEGLLLLLAKAVSKRRVSSDDLVDVLRSKVTFYFKTEPKIKKEKATSVISHFTAFRKERGLTQREMAKKLAISLSYYKKIERGEREPADSLIRKMKRVMKSEK